VTDKPKTSALGMLKALTSVFVEEVHVPDKEAPSGAPPAAPRSPQDQVGAHVAWPAIQPNGGRPASVAPDPDAQRLLEGRLQKAMPPEYRAFMEMYESLKEDIIEEKQRFKVALKTSHTTAAQLMAGLDQLVDAMQTAHKGFLDGFEENRSKVATEAQKSLGATDQLIASNEEQLRSIQQTINTLRAKRDADAQAMVAETSRMEEARLGFEAALAEINGHLDAQRRSVATMTAQAGKG
jgi:hypothetical protein